jgi:predicted ATPase
MPTRDQAPAVPRLTYLRIKNYRALRDVEFRALTPLTVLIGPNGSGKSTVLDALDFLAEAVRGNLVGAWEKRNRFAGMRTRGSEGNIGFEIRIESNAILYHYLLEIQEIDGEVSVINEILSDEILPGKTANTYLSAKYENKSVPFSTTTKYDDGSVIVDSRNPFGFSHIPFLTISSGIAQMRAVEFNEAFSPYRYVHLTDDHLKGYSDAGPREKLSPNGDNLPNVLYYLHTRHPEALAKITAQMRRWVPALAGIVPEITSDERLLLRFKDAPFEKPLPAQYMSDGTMRLAALLTLLYEPDATGLLGIEEPENELHPQLLAYLAEELIAATDTRQLLVATHSPALLNALEPEQVWVLHRGADGYTQATRTADLPGISAMVEEGTPLGYLWSRNFFDVGNPLDLPTPVK